MHCEKRKHGGKYADYKSENRRFSGNYGNIWKGKGFYAGTRKSKPMERRISVPTELVKKDLENKGLLCLPGRTKFAVVFMFSLPTLAMNRIEAGAWKMKNASVQCTCMASAGKVRGVASFCLDWCYARCGNVRGRYAPRKYSDAAGFREKRI